LFVSPDFSVFTMGQWRRTRKNRLKMRRDESLARQPEWLEGAEKAKLRGMVGAV
jgi:hypothetical protein